MSLCGTRVTLAAAAGVLLLAGCAGSETAYYAPPANLMPDQAVSVLGSKDPKGILESSEYRLVWAVDGVPVKDPGFRWQEPLLLTPNTPHHLNLAYGWAALVGGTAIDISAPPGTVLIVQGEDTVPDREARLWLEDARTGRIVGEKQTILLAYSNAGYDSPTITTSTAYSDIIANRVAQPKH